MSGLSYLEYLDRKKVKILPSGFDVDENDLNKKLFPFQRFIVKRALSRGKYAVWADCGLGKTAVQLEWANRVSIKTGRPVLIFTPLAVSIQTINEGVKFGIEVSRYGSGNIQVINYDQIENIDPSLFSGVVLDECFAPDTTIRVMRNFRLLNINIKDCLIGDKVLNCTGLDTVKAVKKKKINYAIKLRFNGQSIISSPRHPYFTQRGWVSAKDIRRGDAIISTDKTMRILRSNIYNSQNLSIEDQILRNILLSEMENETTGTFSQSSQPRSCSEKRAVGISVVKNGGRTKKRRADTKSQSNDQSGDQGQGIGNLEGYETQTFSAWGKWNRDDVAAAINEGCIVRDMGFGLSYITGQDSKGLPDKLQSRFRELRNENSDRVGWVLSSFEKRSGQKERREIDKFRVESFEILEQGCIELDKYRDESGTLYFYDLEIERHPSFTINSGLVHNSSILKNFDGATKKKLIDLFEYTEYKLCCTATPSPNDVEELGNHSEFLNIMKRSEMLAMFFLHDGGDTGKWRLKPHGHKHFWRFVSQWAIMLCKPSDIGFEMQGYDLPSLNFFERKIKTEKRENGKIFNDVAVSATTFNQELRLTKIQRLTQAVEIVNASDESFIIWIKHDEEGDYLRKAIQAAVEVSGSDSKEVKEKNLIGFADGKFRVLITKAKVAQYGLNFQSCHNQIFASLDFSFESLYQGVRRSYRFGQLKPVNIWLITTDTMTNVMESVNKKQSQFLKMQQEMNANMNEEFHNKTVDGSVNNETFSNSRFTLKHGDCIQLIKNVPDESIGFSIFSPPFKDLYTYSDSIEDMGNCRSDDEFDFAFQILANELYRVLWSGRNVAIHCMDLPIQKGKEGYIGLKDFSGEIHRMMLSAGFIYHCRTTIWRNPVTEMQRTKALGLLHKQVKKDAAMSRTGLPDYLLVFRKPGEHLHPVKCDISVDTWQKYASPVWMDIDYSDTLNERSGRDQDDTKHICPLQLPTIERAIHLWTNKGDTVLTPFAGIGSEVYKAVEMERKGIGFELKRSYFDEAIKNIERLESTTLSQVTIFK